MENLDNQGYIDRALYLECRRRTRLCFFPSFFCLNHQHWQLLFTDFCTFTQHCCVFWFEGSVCVIVLRDCKCAVSDYLGTIRFGVVTDKRVAEEISLVHSGSVYLHRHANTSLVSIALCSRDSDLVQGCSGMRTRKLLEWGYWQRFCGGIVGTVKSSILA